MGRGERWCAAVATVTVVVVPSVRWPGQLQATYRQVRIVNRRSSSPLLKCSGQQPNRACRLSSAVCLRKLRLVEVSYTKTKSW